MFNLIFRILAIWKLQLKLSLDLLRLCLDGILKKRKLFFEINKNFFIDLTKKKIHLEKSLIYIKFKKISFFY